jgi:hypothetical protein
MVVGHEEIFPTAELFFSCRGKDCHLPTKRKGIHMVRPSFGSIACQREECYVEGIQETF